MHDTGCLGLVHWDDPEGWYREGGGRRVQDANMCIPVADSCWYMAKPIQYCKVKKKGSIIRICDQLYMKAYTTDSLQPFEL